MAILRRGRQVQGGMKKSQFSNNISLYLWEMMQDRAMVTMEGE